MANNIDLVKLKLKGKTKCDCGYEFTANDIKEIMLNNDVHFYGGAVTHYSVTKCPKCNKSMVILLDNDYNSYKVIDIAEVEEEKEEIVEDIIEIVDEEEEEENTIETVEEVEEEINYVKCEKCGREFKSNAGLSSHKKKCLGNI